MGQARGEWRDSSSQFSLCCLGRSDGQQNAPRSEAIDAEARGVVVTCAMKSMR